MTLHTIIKKSCLFQCYIILLWNQSLAAPAFALLRRDKLPASFTAFGRVIGHTRISAIRVGKREDKRYAG